MFRRALEEALMDATKEKQYQFQIDLRERKGLTPLGLMTNGAWRDDPRRLLFLLARYKFVAKMLVGKSRVLEVGCGDAFGSRIVRQEVPHVCVSDFDPVFVEDVKSRMDPDWPVECRQHDFVSGPMGDLFDAAYSLDVLEHIQPESEERFVHNIARSLTPAGVLIIGTPSIQSQQYASAASKEGHVNCQDDVALRRLMARHFDNVFLFSMNDEVVHTGFGPMAHYLFAVCAGRRQP
jgi:2-polyprenyl-3-methyl-5-hydroxy-6-metoxy-1,4-benzoquinol methylase